MDFSEGAKRELREWAKTRGIGHFRRTCPDCSTERHNKNSECLSADIDADKVLARCWHCERQGAAKLIERVDFKPYVPSASAPVVKQKFEAVRTMGKALDAMTKAFLKGRGISETTAEIFGLTYAVAYFPDMKREGPGLAFPYYQDHKVVGHKVRSTEEKAHVCKPALYSLFGIQNVDMTESTQFLICEGEIDALSMYEAGIPNATSVPNGASSFSRVENQEDAKAVYAFLWTAKKEIDKAKRILIATDSDEPGQRLADELARRVGKHRCWRVAYPDDCKDANDVLLKHGKKKLAECVDKAEPWPIDGLYEASQYFPAVFDLYENGFGERVLTGIPAVDEIYSVGKGLLTIITGIPANGKSTFVDQLMVNMARTRDWTMGICSFENPPHVHIAKLSEMLMQKHFFDTSVPGKKMSMKELADIQPFINQHFKFLQQDDGKKATLDSIIERIKTAVFRWGIQAAVIDPYNYIQRPKSANNETEWIDDMLTQLRLTAQLLDIHIWFVAHPTKLPMDGEGSYPPPRGYSISGSGAWYSKADFGLTVHKVPDRPSQVRIINWKTRFDWLGKEGEASILYDNQKNCYISDAFTDLEPFTAGRYGDDDE